MDQSQSHPKGLYLLFFTEMWERFSYYGMRAIFILFMTKALFMDKALASNIYGSYTGLVYLTPLLGGYISDRYWGNRRSILVGGLLMAIGQFLMFMSGNIITDAGQSSSAITMMWAGLTFLIVGNGFFKPNISTMVGQLYPKGDHRVDGAFTIFYMGINLGAFFSPLVCGGLGDTGNIHDFRWGFLAAGIGMLVSTISFELLKNKYLVTPDGKPVGMPTKYVHSVITADAESGPLDSIAAGETTRKEVPNFSATMVAAAGGILVILALIYKFAVDLDWIGSFIFSAAVALPFLIITDKSVNSQERERILVIFILAFFVIFFWACFEQAGASLTLFADTQTNRTILGWEMPASWFQSINPLAIVALAPIFTMLWNWLNKRNMEPSSPMKMAFGLLLLALGYVVIAYGVHGVDSQTKISMWFLVTLYLLHTMGELCLSPIGLSMVSKLAPIRFASLLMGTWFLANAVANKFAGTLSALIPPGAGETPAEAGAKIPTFAGVEIADLFTFFCVFIVLSGVASIILFGLYRWLEKRMHGVK